MKHLDMAFIPLTGIAILVPVLLLFVSPDEVESRAMLIGSNRLDTVMHSDSDSAYELAQQADAWYQKGGLDRAVEIYEKLDTVNGLDPDGLRKLAFYYGENGNYQNKYKTLFRLAESHLNAEELHETASFFRAVNDSDRFIRSLEIKQARSYNTLDDTLALARYYRHLDHHSLAVQVVESLDVQTLASINREQFDLYLRSKLAIAGTEVSVQDFHAWLHDSLDQQILADRIDVLFDHDLDDIARTVQLEQLPVRLIAESSVEPSTITLTTP